ETQSWAAFQTRIGAHPSSASPRNTQNPGRRNSPRRWANRNPVTAGGDSSIGYFASTPTAEHAPARSHHPVPPPTALRTPTSAQHQQARNGGSMAMTTPAPPPGGRG